jgi:hypothetical protein
MFLFTLFVAGDEQFCGAVIVKIAISENSFFLRTLGAVAKFLGNLAPSICQALY